MKFKFKLLLFFVACLAVSKMSAQTNNSREAQQQQIVDAMLDIYNDELRTDDKNYGVWFRRASLFYGLNQYGRALSDIDNAIKYTPADDLDLLSQEYSLRANIYVMLGQLEKALPDIEKACEADGSSYALLYQKANIEYELGRYQEAKEDYRRLGRIFNRSLESLVGLSRIAVKESNLGMANDYIDQAVQLYPNEPEAYLRRASVRQLLGNNNGAVDDLIVALSLDSSSQRTLSALVNMSNVDYNATIVGLSRAIAQAPENGMFYYIRATIAQAHYHYVAAIADYRLILDRGLYSYYGINASLAECYYALCEFDIALHEINYAIGATAENGAYYITLSKIRLAMGDLDPALAAARTALEKLPDNNKAIYQLARVQIAKQMFDNASASFGELIINMPEDPANYINRGWVLQRLGRRTDAVNFLDRALALEYPENDIRSLRGFALLLLDLTPDARAWIDGIIASRPNDVDGHIYYIAACLYAQLGETSLAFDCLSVALDKGYSNLYNLKYNETSVLNLAPLRDDAEFGKMLKSYDYLFKL